MSPKDTPPRVAVLGLGYVGCVTAACLAKLGHRVIGVDSDVRKTEQILKGRAPFYEPELEPLVSEAVTCGSLSVSNNLASIQSCDVALVCVGTPSEPNGNISLSQLRRVCEEIATYLPKRSHPLTVVIRSTVFPGTCEQVVLPALGNHAAVRVVSSPEFLREGSAVHDFFSPGLLVIGGDDAAAVAQVAGLYTALPTPPLLVSLRAAEMIKYACNCFHAVKISFANEIGSLCNRLDVDGDEVLRMLCSDTQLNISPAYLKPGFAFGGSCLPKDLRALSYRASRLDLSLPMLGNVLASNLAHLKRAIDLALSLPTEKIGVFGLAFKEETDDLRESPVVALIEHLIGKGRDLCIFDPHIQIDRIYGQNQHFALNAIPHIARLMRSSLEEMLASVDHVIVTQRPKPEWQQKLEESGKFILYLYDLSRQEALRRGSPPLALANQDLSQLSRSLLATEACVEPKAIPQ